MMERVSEPSEHHLPPVSWAVLPTGINLVSLGLLTWGVASQIHRLDTTGKQASASVLLAVVAAAWVVWGWLLRSSMTDPGWTSAVPLLVLGVAGGALGAFIPLAMVFPAVAALGSAMRWTFPVALAVSAAGWLVLLSGVLLAGAAIGVALGGLAAVFAGLLVGTTRQEAVRRAAQSARIEIEMARVEVERARAEVLSERNHFARELHDVLAHTLAALSLQLEAFSTVVDAEPTTSSAVRDQLERTRQLVREGLEEARGAVRALRDDPAPLEDQLARLCAQNGATFVVSGHPRRLPGQVVTNVYRVGQEALTNAMKHASGAPVSMTLSYAPATVSLTVDNALAASATMLEGTGSGYGLRGIAERLEILGGHVEAGPSAGGWHVAATVPAPEPPVTAPSAAAP